MVNLSFAEKQSFGEQESFRNYPPSLEISRELQQHISFDRLSLQDGIEQGLLFTDVKHKTENILPKFEDQEEIKSLKSSKRSNGNTATTMNIENKNIEDNDKINVKEDLEQKRRLKEIEDIWSEAEEFFSKK